MNKKGVIGVDIGGTKTRLSMFENGQLEDIYLGPTEQNPEKQLALLINELKKINVSAETCKGIGIACPGPLNRGKGIILSPPNLQKWKDFDLKGSLEKALNIPVCVENDANAGALGEAIHGAGKGLKNIFYLTISTGIGSGVVINKKIHGGANGLAGELWCTLPTFYSELNNGLMNEKVQSVIDLSSGNGIVKQAKMYIENREKTIIPKDNVSTYTIIDAYRNNDKLAFRIIERARDVLAATVNFAVSILDPDIVVLGGGLCFDEEIFVKPIMRKVKQLAGIKEFQNVKIRRAELWENAAVYGAVSLFN